MDYQDYYETLGVSRDADDAEIRKAYRRLARKYHPDVSKEPNAEAEFKRITEAHEVLKDPEKRKLYDELGSNWQSGQNFQPPPGWAGVFRTAGASGSTGFSDFFESLFGSSGFHGDFAHPSQHTNGSHFQRPQSQKVELALALETLYRGEPIEIVVDTAASSGQSANPRRLKVTVPPGLTDGDSFRLKGQGQGNRDLIVRLRVKPHTQFELQGKDVHSDLPVTPWEAALGGSIDVDTLGGKVKLKVPAGTCSGRKMRLKGRGLHDGNHVFTIRIDVPSELSEAERRLFTELASESDFQPRG